VNGASAPLARRLLAELVGTALLVTVVVGSGIAAQQLSPDDVGLQLLENSMATVFGLGVLILLFGPVSGAHFNPVVSAVDWLLGRRAGTGPPGLSGRDVAAYTVAQCAGAVLGAMLANAMFGLAVVQISTKARSGGGHWLGEVVATAGLIALIFALARTGRASMSAAAVGCYIGAAYWFTSSTSFANPAVTIGRIFSDSFAGIAPGSVPGYLAAQIIGAGLGAALVRTLYPETPADHEGASMADAPEVLFVCVHNAGRSQMAAALLHHHAAGAVRVTSAGSAPADQINPGVRQVMDEIGIDLSHEFPKRLSTDAVESADVVITMGCGDACPVFPGKRYLDWQLEDPAGKTAADIRPIRDEIDARVRALLAELTDQPANLARPKGFEPLSGTLQEVSRRPAHWDVERPGG
jgi:arsenate reductase